jgi:hypothetical protein
MAPSNQRRPTIWEKGQRTYVVPPVCIVAAALVPPVVIVPPELDVAVVEVVAPPVA